MQSSTSKLTICPRKGRLLRFQSNSTETSDGSVQKLVNNLWHDDESFANNFESLQSNRSQMKCDFWKPCRNLHWLDKPELRFSIKRFFEQSATVKKHLLCFWPTLFMRRSPWRQSGGWGLKNVDVGHWFFSHCIFDDSRKTIAKPFQAHDCMKPVMLDIWKCSCSRARDSCFLVAAAAEHMLSLFPCAPCTFYICRITL